MAADTNGDGAQEIVTGATTHGLLHRREHGRSAHSGYSRRAALILLQLG
jgi:hypothetical protein